ncbi:MAG: hypothetical protein WD342_12870 [Verrucomicrobiales bacterium]
MAQQRATPVCALKRSALKSTMEDLWEILQNLGYFGVASAAIAWLIKALYGHMMTKDVERFKFELNKAALEHKVAFEHLHEKRATVLVEYYREITKIRSIIAAFRLSIDNDYSEKEKMLLKAVMLGVFNAEKILHENEIFFPDRLRKQARSLNIKMFHYAGITDASLNDVADIAAEVAASPERLSLVATSLKKGFQEVDDKITPLLDEIRHDFQKLLGIEDKR